MSAFRPESGHVQRRNRCLGCQLVLLQAFGASELYTRPKITAAIQANTTFQMTPSINCPTDPIGLVEYKLSQLCVSSALGKSSAARKQRTNRTTNVAVRPQPNGTI